MRASQTRGGGRRLPVITVDTNHGMWHQGHKEGYLEIRTVCQIRCLRPVRLAATLAEFAYSAPWCHALVDVEKTEVSL